MQPNHAFSEEFNDLQRLIDGLFADRKIVDRLDLIVQAEVLDLSPDMIEIVNLVPSGEYDRVRLCDQINSALAAHGWGATYGIVE
ncbi:hypothetical protein [Collinsella provencensis]|uniref:hypothetical protein n=1 Tax=Collinsella provencensis TaxID=1937461 RepID=UPI000C81E1EC|nr:hypothetical protein [Collinsella provencensis]